MLGTAKIAIIANEPFNLNLDMKAIAKTTWAKPLRSRRRENKKVGWRDMASKETRATKLKVTETNMDQELHDENVSFDVLGGG